MRKWMVYGLVAVMTLVLLQGIGSGTSPVQANAGTQWNAQYFNNTDLSGSPTISRIDDKIDFNWGGGSPDPAIQADNFSVRWTKTVNFPTPGSWTFRAGADDGIRMWIDTTQIINEWHGNPEGYKTYEVTLSQLTAGNHDLKVEYYDATSNAGAQVTWSSSSGAATTTTTTSAITGTGTANWNAQYFNNNSLSGSPVVTRTEQDINFNWGTGSPDGAVPADNFSARWTASVNFPTPGHWHFTVTVDDGVRMWVDVTPIIDQWHGSPSGTAVYEVDLQALTAGPHELKVEYYDATGNANIQVRWSDNTGAAAAGSTTTATAAPPVKPVYAAVTVTQLNVRSGPGRNYPVISKVTYPKNYPVLGAVPDMSWILIDLKNGQSGWVSNDWVWLYSSDSALNADADGDTYQDFVFLIPRIEPATVAAQAAAATNPVSTVTVQGLISDVVNVRDGATLYSSNIIASIQPRTYVTVEARNGNGAWYLVSAPGGIRGWVSASFVSLTFGRVSDLLVSTEVVPAPPQGSVFVPQTDQGTPRTVRGRANSKLTFRDAASTQGKNIGEVAQGTEFIIDGRNTNGAWYLVTINGTQGWVYSPGVDLIEGAVSDLAIR